jgi:hypothetical protein
VPHTPDFLWSFVGSLNFLRLSLKKGAHAVLSRAAYRKFGVSRSFFARCGRPRLFAPDFFAAGTFSQPRLSRSRDFLAAETFSAAFYPWWPGTHSIPGLGANGPTP